MSRAFAAVTYWSFSSLSHGFLRISHATSDVICEFSFISCFSTLVPFVCFFFFFAGPSSMLSRRGRLASHPASGERAHRSNSKDDVSRGFPIDPLH